MTVNGRTVTELGTKADPGTDDIRVDGRRVKAAQRRRYILLYKPRGYITTRSDPAAAPDGDRLAGEGRRQASTSIRSAASTTTPKGCSSSPATGTWRRT